jgi:uncharacterized protein (UPF0248 family)
VRPIHELLNRIRWDEDFARGDFVIGYYDRVTDGIIEVAVHDVFFEPDDHFCFYLVDDSGETHSVPLHRIRDVYRNGERIWHRDAPGRH